jgi:hypothetical protein
MRFLNTPFVEPSRDLHAEIEAEYRRSEYLFYGTAPSLAEIYARFDEFRHRL